MKCHRFHNWVWFGSTQVNRQTALASEAYSVQAPDLAFISFLLLLLRTLAMLSITQGLGPKMLSLISSSHKILKMSLPCRKHLCVTHPLRLAHLCSPFQVSVYMLFPLAAF